MDEFTGFTAGESTPYEISTGSIAELAHKRLDQIMVWVQNGSGGGDFVLTDIDTGRSYRITFCNFTGQLKCTHCGGTGTEGSDFQRSGIKACVACGQDFTGPPVARFCMRCIGNGSADEHDRQVDAWLDDPLHGVTKC
jgi:hypothetical protein